MYKENVNENVAIYINTLIIPFYLILNVFKICKMYLRLKEINKN